MLEFCSTIYHPELIFFFCGLPSFRIRARDEAHVFPTAADELEVAVLLHPPFARLQIPKAHLHTGSGGRRK